MKKGYLLTKTIILSLVLILGLSACGEDKTKEKKEDNGKETEQQDEKSEAKNDEVSDKEEKEPLIVGTEAGFAPFEYVGSNNEVVGVDIDIAKAIADKLGRKLEIKNMSFDGALLEVQEGKIDLVAAGVSITDERKEVMDFSDPYFSSFQVIVVNAENPKVQEASPKGLKDKIIGAQLGTVGDLWVNDNVEAKELRTYKQLSVAMMDLEQDKIDGIIMDNIVAKDMVASTDGKLKIVEGDPILEDKTGLALPKNSDLLPVVNEVLKELKEQGKIDEFFENHKQSE